MMRCLIASFGTLLLLYCITSINSKFECGKLNNQQLHDEKPEASLDEFPWIARIYYVHRETGDESYKCVANLITERHLLTAAHCFTTSKILDPKYVLLGDTNANNSNVENDCINDICAPPPKTYLIQDIAIHPQHHRIKRINDIAIIRLEKDVEFSDYIQPICLPPYEAATKELVAQYYIVAGFLYNRNNVNLSKTKTVAHVISPEQCNNTFSKADKNNPQVDSTVICASYVDNYIYLSGSMLMGVNVEKSNPKSFYSIGTLSYGTNFNKKQTTNDAFMRTASHLNWIMYNIKNLYKKRYELVNLKDRLIFA